MSRVNFSTIGATLIFCNSCSNFSNGCLFSVNEPLLYVFKWSDGKLREKTQIKVNEESNHLKEKKNITKKKTKKNLILVGSSHWKNQLFICQNLFQIDYINLASFQKKMYCHIKSILLHTESQIDSPCYRLSST